MSEDHAFDAGEQHSVERRDVRLRRLAKEADAAFGALLEQRQGRRWVWQLLEQAGIFQSSYRPEALAMAFREGERNMGLRVLADLNRLAPESYALMQAENAPTPEPTT